MLRVYKAAGSCLLLIGAAGSLMAEDIRKNDCTAACEEIRISGRLYDVKLPVTALSLDVNVAGLRIDQQLSSVPGIKLFRRADSFSAHPTTQGLSMRGIGANAAGRVLVTLDGIPLNDPFGGWIYWSQLNDADVGGVDIIRGGAAGAFAALGLSGQVRINSQPVVEDKAHLRAGFGNRGQRQIGFSGHKELSGTAIAATLNYGEGDGFYLLDQDQRGHIDAKTAYDQLTGHISVSHRYSDGGEAGFVIRHFEESRQNGYALAPNDTQAQDYIFRLAHQFDKWGFETIQWYKERDFANVFVAARDDRTVERPVLDQYNVPAWGLGGLMRLSTQGIEFGLDWRRMSGSTHELFRNLGGGFTRERQAGGDQRIIGGYVAVDQKLTDRLRVDGTVRLDQYRTFNGERFEFNLADLRPVRREDYDNQSGTQMTGGLAWTYALQQNERQQLFLTGGLSKSWRLPSLNEYFRPFRVGNDITEANGELRPEKLYTLEAGLAFKTKTLGLNLNAYHATLKGGVGNITIGFGPGFYPLGGFVPAGGVLRQRANIDEVTTDGVELDMRYQQDIFTIGVNYLYARGRVTDFDSNPDLVGKRPSQTPRHSLTVMGQIGGQEQWVRMEGRYQGRTADDDLNERWLGDVFTVGLSAGHVWNDQISVQLRIDNIFDQRVISALSAIGLETLAQRRSVFLNVGYSF